MPRAARVVFEGIVHHITLFLGTDSIIYIIVTGIFISRRNFLAVVLGSLIEIFGTFKDRLHYLQSGNVGDLWGQTPLFTLPKSRFSFRIAMQSEKKIKTIQEEISYCRDIGPRRGMTFPRAFGDRLHYLHCRNHVLRCGARRFVPDSE